MITSDEDKDHQEEQMQVDSIATRRRILDSLSQNFRGTNPYGGERCTCHCGNVHWKPREETKPE